MDGIFFVVDTTDRQRLSVVQEVIMEMAKHPVLRARSIPFVVLANKQDLPGHVEEEDLAKIIQVEQLAQHSKMTFHVKNTTGRVGDGVNECFNIFDGRV